MVAILTKPPQKHMLMFARVDTNHNGVITWKEAGADWKQNIMGQTTELEARIRTGLKFNRPLITFTQVGFQFSRSTLDAVYALILAISIRRM